MARTRMARLTEAEWKALHRIKERERLTREVLAREAQARSLRDLVAEKLHLKQAEVAALQAELAEDDAKAAAASLVESDVPLVGNAEVPS